MPIQFRKPRRLSVTINEQLYQRLLRDSDQQGRSLSNYAAFLLENALEHSIASEQRAATLAHQSR
jgi:hypothetical protein